MNDFARDAADSPIGATVASHHAGDSPRSYAWLVWLAAASGVVGQLLFSNDWCLYTIPAAFLAAFAFWGVVAFITLLSRSGRPPPRSVGLVLAIVVGLGSGAVFRVIPSWAFNEAFGMDQPGGIRDLRIWRHLEGGPGEHSLILEFKANEATICALVASFPHQPDKPPGMPNMQQLQREWQENRSWMAVYELFGGAIHSNGRKTWERITPLRDADVFYRGGIKSTLMLLDRTSGRAVALHSRG